MTLVWDDLCRTSSAWMPSKQNPICTIIQVDIQVFHFHFADFADFEDFHWPALQEGAVCSWSLYGMNCRVNRALKCDQNRVGFAQELVDILMFFINLCGIQAEIEYVFCYISSTSGHTAKRTMPSDLAHQIGPSTLWKDVLTVDEGVCGWMFKNSKMGHIFCHISTTRARTSKQTTPLDSAHWIGVSTL